MKVNWLQIHQYAQNAQNGDKQNYQLFLSAISEYLKLKLRNTLPVDANEDVHQEILIAIHKSFHTLNLSLSLQSWVNAIAKYKVSDYLRSYYKKDKHTDTIVEDVQTIDFDLAEFKELLKFIKNTLQAKEEKILLLLKYEGYTINEVSKKMQLSPQNIKVICHRAIKKLRHELLRRDFYE